MIDKLAPPNWLATDMFVEVLIYWPRDEQEAEQGGTMFTYANGVWTAFQLKDGFERDYGRPNWARVASDLQGWGFLKPMQSFKLFL